MSDTPTPKAPPSQSTGPSVSFGTYVRPETVQEKPEPDAIALPFLSPHKTPRAAHAPGAVEQGRKAFAAVTSRLSAFGVAVGVICATVCVLGIMVLVYFTRAPQTEVAETPQAVGTAQAPDALAAAVAASLDQNVTRAAPVDLITPTAAVPLTEMFQGLAPPQLIKAATVGQHPVLSRDTLSVLRDHVLRGEYEIAPLTRDGSRRLGLRIAKGAVPLDAAADVLVAAAQQGTITLPAALHTAAGTLDGDTLIFNLVQNSLAQDGSAAGKKAAEQMRQRAVSAATARSVRDGTRRLYTVLAGDSLAQIAVQFYGAADSYTRILAANQSLLATPKEIQIGQRLIIPN